MVSKNTKKLQTAKILKYQTYQKLWRQQQTAFENNNFLSGIVVEGIRHFCYFPRRLNINCMRIINLWLQYFLDYLIYLFINMETKHSSRNKYFY